MEDTSIAAEIIPLNHKFSVAELTEYFHLLQKPDDASAFLAKKLGLNSYRFDARQAIQLDYTSHWLEFAMQQGYGPQRTSSLLRIAFLIFDVIAIRRLSLGESEAALRGALIRVTSASPGADGPTFSPEQIANVAATFAQGIFRHASLYRFVFSEPQGHKQLSAQLLVETPVIPSFEEALSQQQWDDYHEAARVKAAEQKRAEEEAERQRLEEAEKEAKRLAAEEAERLRQEELARKPATLEEAVSQLVALRLENEKQILTEELKKKGDTLASKVEAMEAVIKSTGKK
mmetsp:Transcript_2339/g.3544  ORF Transcript_2339/g.3544 Transcript_2339/m.3544 type:complete len:288 (-) Transcript_2339:152-1015(-)